MQCSVLWKLQVTRTMTFLGGYPFNPSIPAGGHVLPLPAGWSGKGFSLACATSIVLEALPQFDPTPATEEAGTGPLNVGSCS